MTLALLLLGGNVGDRAARLSAAAAALGRLPGCRLRAKSRVYETAPVGPSDRPYLNQAISLDTRRTAMGLLVEAKVLEARAGRRPGPRWAARPLDVDLLCWGSARIRTPWLTVPHPLAAVRSFALAPLRDIAPGWRPDGRRPVRDLLAALDARDYSLYT